MEPDLKVAIGIARRSDIKQQQNASIETQSEEIQSRAKLEGYEVIEIFIDDANSAYHKLVTARKAMNDLLEAALAEELNVEAIFFYEESRLSRQFYDFTLFIHDIIKQQKPHIKFFSTCTLGEWDPYNLMSVMKFAHAAKESSMKSTRAIDGQNRVLRNQERPGSKVPYGYKLVYPSTDQESLSKIKGEQIIHPETSQIVKFIFHLASWGHSQQSIADLLNEASISSPRGKCWNSGTIDYILYNDQYLGHLPWNIRKSRNTTRKKQRGEYDLIYNHHEPIINVHLWQMTHQTIELHKQNGKNNSSHFVLRGILYCKKCDQSLIAKNETPKGSKRSYLVYRCPTCRQRLSADDIHNEMQKELSAKFLTTLAIMENNTLAALITKRQLKIIEHRDAISTKLKEIQFKEEFLMNQPEKASISNWHSISSIGELKLKRDLDKANTYIEHINLFLEGIQSNQALSLLNLESLSNIELRTLILVLFKRITVDFDNGRLLYVDYRLTPFTQIDRYLETVKS